MTTLIAKHPNLFGPLQEYPWMITGSGRPPPVSDVWKPSNITSLEGLVGSSCMKQCLSGRQLEWILNPAFLELSVLYYEELLPTLSRWILYDP
ncbi:hypothetical protein K2173_003386 [Erythroxylum novogranatense]|uniref:Uncharacterized protein n=1 Tax=Erythroxylum novogranatense TaxID=1862640 RepID=A0AAV8S8S5_9ROSI|nr:hypothetical protein K2173_003386 [Erythroxylum novogranatense]